MTSITQAGFDSLRTSRNVSVMVNTFLPYASFTRSAHVLDRARLGKQRVECLQLLRALTGETVGWRNHPAAIMWQGYEPTLAVYGIKTCDEWLSRGYRDTCRGKIIEMFPQFEHFVPSLHQIREDGELPWWFTWRRFHESHRSNLMRKDPDYYSQFTTSDGWFILPVEPGLPYVWPSSTPYRFKMKHAKGS